MKSSCEYARSLTTDHYWRTLLPSSHDVLKVHQDSYDPEMEDEVSDPHVVMYTRVHYVATQLLDLYFQLSLLTDAVSRDDSMSCTELARDYAGDTESLEGNVRDTNMSENK